jgi:hypothetical protein
MATTLKGQVTYFTVTKNVPDTGPHVKLRRPFNPMLRIQTPRIGRFSGLSDPQPDPLVTRTEPTPDPSLFKQMDEKFKTLISTVK